MYVHLPVTRDNLIHLAITQLKKQSKERQPMLTPDKLTKGYKTIASFREILDLNPPP